MVFQKNLIYFGKFSFKIWPLFDLFRHLGIWPFLKLLMAKFGLFNFLGPGNPDLHPYIPAHMNTHTETCFYVFLTLTQTNRLARP
jgi:hypothetical protein